MEGSSLVRTKHRLVYLKAPNLGLIQTRLGFIDLVLVKYRMFPDSFDIDYVREKHPKLAHHGKDWLVKRLGKAIAKRRQFMKYCRDPQRPPWRRRGRYAATARRSYPTFV